MDPSKVAVARACILRGDSVHMAGVGGVGMAGLALLLQARGLRVTGCDLRHSTYTRILESAGIPVREGHGAGHLSEGAGWVIRSTAVRPDTDELVAAQSARLPVLQRGVTLAALTELAATSVSVAGTHGKTTTATLLATLLQSRGAGWCIGGVSQVLPVPASPGEGILVVEADESDGTLAEYRTHVAVVTNVDFDHMEHFASVTAFEDCFRTFMQKAGQVVYCADDPRAAQLAKEAGQKAIGYGFSALAAMRGFWDASSRMLVVQDPGGGRFPLPVPASLPGHHNLLNLLAAVAACRALQIPADEIMAAVPGLSLPARRYETISDAGQIRIVSDYAHHPAEIAALVRMARTEHAGRIVAVFQPHRYTRTAALAESFPAAFVGVDALILTPVYAASEPPQPGGTASDLYAAFRRHPEAPLPELAVSLSQVSEDLVGFLQPGDLLLVIGAGDIETVAPLVAEGLRQAARDAPAVCQPISAGDEHGSLR